MRFFGAFPVVAVTLVFGIFPDAGARALNQATAKQALLAQGSPSTKTPVMSSFIHLRRAEDEATALIKATENLSNLLEQSMIDVSYPVMLPSIAGGNPVTLATPDPKLYSGHFDEPKRKSIVSGVANVGDLLSLLQDDVSGIQMPEDRTTALKPILDDITKTLAAVKDNFAIIQNKMSTGPEIDAEAIAAKLKNMQADLGTISKDLKTAFQIINLQALSPDAAQSLSALRILSRNAYWLGRTAKYLYDNTRELNPVAAEIQDAQDSGWLVFGVPNLTYSGLHQAPYLTAAKKLIDSRMSEIGQYLNALQADIEAIPQSTGTAGSHAMAQIQALVADANSRYATLKELVAARSLDQAAIAKSAQSIAKDMQELDRTVDKLTAEVVAGKPIL